MAARPLSALPAIVWTISCHEPSTIGIPARRRDPRRQGRGHSRVPVMSRPCRIPDRGDVAASIVAARLGLSLSEFESRRAELGQRGFPAPDETTGRYCMEAVDRWRLRRYSRLFPELTAVTGAVDARTVVEDRLAVMRKGQR
jgi:hypothetical protein